MLHWIGQPTVRTQRLLSLRKKDAATAVPSRPITDATGRRVDLRGKSCKADGRASQADPGDRRLSRCAGSFRSASSNRPGRPATSFAGWGAHSGSRLRSLRCRLRPAARPAPGTVRTESNTSPRMLRVQRVVVGRLERGDDPAADALHLADPHAAGGQGRRADANARGVHRLALVEGDHVLVDRDAAAVEHFFGLLAAQAQRGDVDQHQVVVGAAADQPHAAGQQRLGQGLGVVDDRLGVALEVRAAALRRSRPPCRR